MTPVRRPPRGSRAAGGNRPIQRLARGSRTRVVTSRPRRDARGRHGWGAGLERACASPGVPGLTSSLVNVWVVLGGRSSEDLLLRGRPRDVHQHFPHFEKMASFQPVTTAPQVRLIFAHENIQRCRQGNHNLFFTSLMMDNLKRSCSSTAGVSRRKALRNIPALHPSEKVLNIWKLTVHVLLKWCAAQEWLRGGPHVPGQERQPRGTHWS
ncbi:uncharacterized protein LOC129659703 isoform X2 [Bubalus kerabau]|uniref:uncharacterized protein LOC129659703 isoform X2 n=1 Tax=Bubalus carabanensis TaxID=3119969 RepID=UPI00244EDA2E|nr:uncharacterized protein LOC129659703 isoform X2 [Bubalus carabanensis]